MTCRFTPGSWGPTWPGRPSVWRSRRRISAWLEPYLADEEAKAATVMVLFEMLKYEKANNLFKARHWAHYLNTFGDFHRAR